MKSTWGGQGKINQEILGSRRNIARNPGGLGKINHEILGDKEK
jgi:hypothetical protein